MLVFNRGTFNELWITIKAGEPLAILDTAYIEDYFGVDGQLTLHKMADDTRTSFVMTEDVDETPSIPHDVFTGFVSLVGLDDGIYRVEGRVRDSLGNYRILSAFQSPLGTEDITLFEIEITPLTVVVRTSIEADIFQVFGPEADVFSVNVLNADIVYVSTNIGADVSLAEKITADVYVKSKLWCDITIKPSLELDVLSVYTKA